MKMLRTLLSLGTVVVLGLSSDIPVARGQVYPTSPNTASWGTYTPGSSWGTYVPAPGWSGVTPVLPSPPPATAGTVSPYSSNAQAWAGYAPQRSWVTYAPQTAWTGYAPANGWIVLPQAPSVSTGSPRWYGTENGRVTASYREFGTGLPVPLHKPWLPGSP